MRTNDDSGSVQGQPAFEQALSLHQKGRLGQAQEIYRQVLKVQPNHTDALHLLGLIAYQTGNFPQAVELIGRAIELNPQSAAAYNHRGLALRELRRLDEALDSYDRAISLQPDAAEAYSNRGLVLQELNRPDIALENYDRALALNSNFAEAYYNRGNALQQLKRMDEAIDSYDFALKFKPDYPVAYNNRGNALQEKYRLNEAVDSYDCALRLKPDYAMAYYNRGNALQQLKRFDEALDSYERALNFNPDFASGHLTLSQCRLLMGDFKRGWEGYEWRWKKEELEDHFESRRHFKQPLWLGTESLQGKSILLYSEQGLGDTLQFCRYAKLVSDLGAHVILEVPKPLIELLQSLTGPETLIAKGSNLPQFDYHCPLLSLPLAFNTDLRTIPAPIGYISSDPKKVAKWKAMLGKPTKPRVGLAWSGSANYKDDSKRSITLNDLAKHLPPNCQYFSLQKEIRDAERGTFDSQTSIVHFGADFTDTAALCELMDIVVSVDTSIAHLAGAMGRPVWILLPFLADWRWLLDREDSVWYPSAKLFRQDKIGDWGSVLHKVRMELLLQLHG